MRFISALLFSIALLSACAGPTTLKSPCAGAPGSPCERTPLMNEPIEVTT